MGVKQPRDAKQYAHGTESTVAQISLQGVIVQYVRILLCSLHLCKNFPDEDHLTEHNGKKDRRHNGSKGGVLASTGLNSAVKRATSQGEQTCIPDKSGSESRLYKTINDFSPPQLYCIRFSDCAILNKKKNSAVLCLF